MTSKAANTDKPSSSRDLSPTASGVRILNVGGQHPPARVINLRDLGFVGTVSAEARAEIGAQERRAARVLATAHLYWFGGSPCS